MSHQRNSLCVLRHMYHTAFSPPGLSASLSSFPTMGSRGQQLVVTERQRHAQTGGREDHANGSERMVRRVLHLQGKAFMALVLCRAFFFCERMKGATAFISKYKLCSALTYARVCVCVRVCVSRGQMHSTAVMQHSHSPSPTSTAG